MDPDDGEDVEVGLETIRLVSAPDGRIRIPSMTLGSLVVVRVEDLERLLTAAYGLGRSHVD